jgi:4-carboxymuconolactone decarboxylase
VSDERYQAGLRVRREVLGDEHVDRSLARATAFDADFQHYITEMAWGSVWTRPGLERQTRSLITLSVLAALGRHEELALHLRASQRIGVPREEIAETLLQVAVYAGVPAANSAIAIAKRVFAELDAEEGQ